MANVKRMKLAIATMERVVAEDLPFDQSVWRYPAGVRVGPGCETVACAGGWMVADPAHQAEGLKANSVGEPSFENERGIPALLAYLDIPQSADRWNAAFRIFDRMAYPGRRVPAQEVLDRMREVFGPYIDEAEA